VGDKALFAGGSASSGSSNVVDLFSLSGGSLSLGTGAGTVGCFNLTGGTLTVTTVNLSAGGTFNQTGGTLKAATFNQTGGIASVDGIGSLWNNTGSLYVGGNDSEASGTGSVTVKNGGQLTVGGTLKLWKADSTVTVSGGTLTAGVLAGSAGTLHITDPAGGMALTVGSDASGSFSGTILDDTSPGSLTKVGSGTQTLSGANSYSGATNLNAGVLQVSAGSNLGNQASSNSLHFGGGTLRATDTFSTSRGVTVGAGGGTLEVADTKEVTLTGNFGIVSGGATMTKQGAGTLTVAGPQAHASAAGLIVNAGTLNVNTDAGDASHSNLSVTAGNNSVVTFGATQHLAALALNNTVVATVTSGGTKTLVTKTLSLASATAKLDLTDNNLIVDYADGGPSPYAEIRDYIKVGRGTKDINGAYLWDGLGITSSAAQANYQLNAIGILDNGFLAPGYKKTDLEGVPVDATAVMVKFTYYGDANLDGKVDRNDLNVFITNYLVPPSAAQMGWQAADFNDDGVVDRNDLNLFMYGYLHQGDLLAGGIDLAALNTVPEPGTLALLALAATAVAARRRRRLVT
jgi:autotransporter-associated beta strand protein/T5SS/PEP-CTERM-associated repeat protein